MDNKSIILGLLPLLCACGTHTVGVQVASDRDFDTEYEIVSLDILKLPADFKTSSYVLKDADGKEVPYQLTYDNKLIFPASVKANSAATYSLYKGTPTEVDTLATGRLYPERHDDMAWENDKIGFRAYGPESQRIGDRLYGYDIFLKRNTDRPMIEYFMAMNNSPEICARIDSLRRAGDKAEASRLSNEKSYHIDHGYGMDCYAVGPTLGAATSAIIDCDTIVYPWCFSGYEVLDNGPLRFTVRLDFPTVKVGNDDVTEHRVITLEAGTHLNYTTVTYDGLSVPSNVVTGIVVHDGSDKASCIPSDRFIAYADPTQGSDNGEIYIGAVFAEVPEDAKIAQNGSIKHVAAYNVMTDAPRFAYYWGAGWNRSDIPTWETWIEYLRTASDKVAKPLEIKVK